MASLFPPAKANPVKRKRALYAVVTTSSGSPIFKTGSAPRDETLDPTNTLPTDFLRLAQLVKNTIIGLPPGYSAECTVNDNVNAMNFIISLRLTIENENKVSASTSLDYRVMDESDEVVQDLIGDLVQKAYDALNREIHVGWGDYPNVRIWAVHHLNMLRHDAQHKEIPGFVFPKWNKSHNLPNAEKIEALKTGGLKEDGVEMSATKRKVKIVPGSTKMRAVRTPECPLHKAKMVFNAEENIWGCPEVGCEIIFRPKQEERPLGSVVVGKGATTMKLLRNPADPKALPTLLLVSDDNVAIDISQYVTQIELNNSPDPLSPPTIELTIRGMNIVQESR